MTRLDLPGTSGLRDRLAAIARQAGMAVCGAGCMGFVNVVRDAALGPLMVISAGGVLIEILAERAALLAPVTRSAAVTALRRLRLAALLTVASVSRRVREFGTLKALGWRAHLTVTVIGPPGAGGPPGGSCPFPFTSAPRSRLA